jgi:hypothetical protein
VTSDRPKTPDLLLEQLALGELAPSDERLLREQLGASEIEQRLSALGADDTRFHAEHDAVAMGDAIKQRLRVERARADVHRSRRASSLRYLLPSVAALGAALLLYARMPEPASQGPVPGAQEVTEPTERSKGIAAHLVLYRRAGELAETLGNGAHARQGDMLQVGYVSAQARHGVIVSLDGSGAVTLHFPDAESASTKLESEGEQLLDHAYELDGAPAFERFFFVTSSAPIDPKRVLGAAEKLSRTPDGARRGALPLPTALHQHSLVLVKE